MHLRNTSLLSLVTLAGTLGCDIKDFHHGTTTGETTTADPTIPENTTTADPSAGETGASSSHKVDLVFIVDDTGSMGGAQTRLAALMPALIDQVSSSPGADWRFGVISTDVGNPLCQTAETERGNLQMTSCLQRIDDFMLTSSIGSDTDTDNEGGTGTAGDTDIEGGTSTAGDTGTTGDIDVYDTTGSETGNAIGEDVLFDARYACQDHCTLDAFEIVPTATAVDPTPRPRRWLELNQGTTNVEGDPRDVLSCMVPRGVQGCPFESPLEALFGFISGAQTEGHPNYGFIRDDAHLVVVFVTDETDCSAQIGSIFGPEQKTFWSDPAESSPSSALCWNAGTRCEGPANDLSCVTADYTEDGTPATSPEEAVLYPLSRYRESLEHLRDQKAPHGAKVATFGVVGVPSGFSREEDLKFAHDGSPIDEAYGIAAACSSEDAFGIPPLRILDVLSDREDWPKYAISICDPSYAPLILRIMSELGL